MSPESFASNAPGRLVPTVFDETAVDASGQIRTQKHKGWSFVPSDLPPVIDIGCFMRDHYDEVVAAERGLAKLDGVGEDLPNARLLWAPLAHREAILSSKIEDTVASAEEIASLEAGEKPERKAVVEVSNYVGALHHGLQSELPICLRLITQMHGILLSNGVRGGETKPGKFRTNQNYIGNEADGFGKARFVPPPAGDFLEGGLQAFEKYANQKKYGLPRLVAIAMMHYQFEALHPFQDGNGRIGRLISALSLCRMDLLKQPFVYLSGYFEPRRDAYGDLLLRVSTHGEWREWIVFFLKAVAHQSADAADRVRSLRNLRDQYRRHLVNENAPGKVFDVVDRLFMTPAITAEMVAKATDVSKPTARSYIDRLVEMKALREMPRHYRKMWVATEIIALIDADRGRRSPDAGAAA